ncbi:MAG: tRNA 2-thiouridine(34) synthase MnmA [Solirubrobacterales bacterium]
MFDSATLFADHVASPRGRDALPADATTGSAGGSACGDLVTVGVEVDQGIVRLAGFTADGCAALTASASALVELLIDTPLLEAARLGRDEIIEALDGLSVERRHAAILVEEALHRALGRVVSEGDDSLLAPARDRKLVAMSGGVDSATAARLLAENGAETVGLTLQLWDDPATDGTASCCSPQAVTAARRLAHEMDMPHFTVDLRDAFRMGVVDPYISAFGDGDTPNPCVGCNGHVRFDALDRMRDRLGAETLATGHYARVERDAQGPLLAAAEDDNKDQTYMLAAVEPDLIARLEFPLGELKKPQVREHAKSAGLSVADKPESQDLCFLAGTGRDEFLERHGGIVERAGAIVDQEGNQLGTHVGAHRFTVGQRRGLGVAASEPLYVLDVNNDENRVVVGPLAALETSEVRLIGARLLRDGAEVDRVKLRYRNAPTECEVVGDAKAGRHRDLRLKLRNPVNGAAPGQVACLMRGEAVVGWATIARDRPDDARIRPIARPAA